MLKYTLKRLLMMIPVLLGVSFVVFLLMYISPGDPAKMILGEMAEKGEIEALRETLGLNAGFWERYFNYMKDILLYGDLGISYVTREPVISEVMERFPVTLRLASSGVLVSLCIGVPCGIIAATKQYSVFDHVATLTPWKCDAGVLDGNTFDPYFLCSAGMASVIGIHFYRVYDPSGTDIRNKLRCRYHAYDTVKYVRGNPSGLHKNCKVKGTERKHSHLFPCLKKCIDSCNHGGWSPVWNAVRWFDIDGNYFLNTGYRKINGRFD